MGYFGVSCPVSDPAARGVLHQPLAAGPCTRVFRVFRGLAGEGPLGPFFGEIAQNEQFWGSGTPEGYPASRPGDRAPARGVDVKHPSRARSRPGPGPPGSPRWSGTPPGVRNWSGGPSGASRGPGDPLPGPRGGWFYINPSRRGPAPAPDRVPDQPGRLPLLRRRGWG